jgi:hypothetical protein
VDASSASSQKNQPNYQLGQRLNGHSTLKQAIKSELTIDSLECTIYSLKL